MQEINLKDFKDLRQESKEAVIVNSLNAIVREINQGVVWDNKVQTERDVNGVYDSLPTSVVAEMIEEEIVQVTAELGL